MIMPSYYPVHASSQLSLQAPELGHQSKADYYHGSCDYADAYGPYSNAGSQELGFQAHDPFGQYQPGTAALLSSAYGPNNGYHAMGTPMVSQLRVNQQYLANQAQFTNYQQASSYSEPKPKEEKARGGVSATLDYEMDQMTGFVAEMSVGMYDLYASRICIADIDLTRSVKTGVTVSPAFREWVLSVLTATRLPSATILMSLSYLALRIRSLSASGTFSLPIHGLRQMVTIGLILGSKFLDDNTFQNKSWAEVSHISVIDLNKEEREWLACFGHRLHHDPKCSDGYESWQQQWIRYTARAASASVALRPIDTNIRRHRSMQALSSTKYASHYARTPTSGYSIPSAFSDGRYAAQSYSPFDAWCGHRSAAENSPSTAPPTGPHTPEYYGGQGLWAGQLDGFARQNLSGYQSYPQNSIYHSGYPTPPYNPLPASYWNCHGAACQCHGCRKAHHMLPTRFGQIAVG